MIKTILAPLSGSDGDKIILDTALAVARRFSSHIECYHSHLGASDVAAHTPHFPSLMGGALRESLAGLGQRGEARAASALRHFNEFRGRHQIPADVTIPYSGVSASIQQGTGEAADNLSFRARHNDLVVMGRPKITDGVSSMLVQRVLLEGGQPVLLVPESPMRALLETVAVCWKNTPEASRAVTASLPLLKHAKRVIVLNIDERNDVANDLSIQAILRRLAWHGVKAVIGTASGNEGSVIDRLWSSVVDCEADLLVMGAYSRGPVRELVFGGCTDSVLAYGSLPVFIVH